MRYEQTRSEARQYSKSSRTSNEYFITPGDRIVTSEYDEKRNQRLGERVKEFGTNPRPIIQEGTNDRMEGVVYDPTKYANKQDQNAYKDGFFVRGSRTLAANLENLGPLELKRVARSDVLSGAVMKETPLLKGKKEDYLKYLEECKKVGEEILKRQQAAMQIYSGGYKNAGQIVIDSMQGKPKPR